MEKGESGMCPSLQRAPEGQAPPHHHFSRDGDRPCISRPNAACELVTPVHGLKGRRLYRGFLMERLRANATGSPEPLGASCPLGTHFTFTWSHMTVGFGRGGCGTILENHATSSHASPCGVSCPGGNRMNCPSSLVAPCKQGPAPAPSLPSRPRGCLHLPQPGTDPVLVPPRCPHNTLCFCPRLLSLQAGGFAS